MHRREEKEESDDSEQRSEVLGLFGQRTRRGSGTVVVVSQ